MRPVRRCATHSAKRALFGAAGPHTAGPPQLSIRILRRNRLRAQDYLSQMRCFLRRRLWDCDKIQEGEQTMQFIKELFSVNEILTVSIMGWFVAQVLKTIINFILLGKFQLERMWGDGGMPSAHSATVCAMVIAAARSEESARLFCRGQRGRHHHHARCNGRAPRDRRAGQGAQPDDRRVDRHQRKRTLRFCRICI